MGLAALYECFAHPVRLRILALLENRPLCVSELQEILGVSQVEVSRQLACLRKIGYVRSSKAGARRYYRLATERTFEFEAQLRCLRECIEHGKLLEKEFHRLSSLPTRDRSQPTGVARRAQREKVAPKPSVEDGVSDNGLVLEPHLL